MKPLTEALVDLAGEADTYDVTERVIRRARRRWLRYSGRLALVAGAVVTVLVIGVVVRQLSFMAGGGSGTGGNGEPRIASPLITELIDSPTRGSLGGDAAYLAALRKAVAGDRLGGFLGMGGDRLPADAADVRVLFAGDVPGGRRVAIVAAASGRPMTATFEGAAGAAAGRLNPARWGDLDAPVYLEMGDGYVVLIGPASYTVEVSARPRYTAGGTVERTWVPDPSGAVVRASASMPPGLRVRLSRDGTVLYEANLPGAGRSVSVKVDPQPLYGRGIPLPDTARLVADALAHSSGLTDADARYVVLWSDGYTVDDPDGGGSGTGGIATVMAITPDGGGPYLTYAFDTNKPPTGRNHPTGAGVLGDPARGLIAMRLPHWTAQPTDALQVIAPPAAVRVEVLRNGVTVATAPLDRGVARLDLAAPAEVTVRALDASGATVAETAFTDDVDQRRSATGEPEIHNW